MFDAGIPGRPVHPADRDARDRMRTGGTGVVGSGPATAPGSGDPAARQGHHSRASGNPSTRTRTEMDESPVEVNRCTEPAPTRYPSWMPRWQLNASVAPSRAATTVSPRIYLFGSIARGESRAGSDLDVAVLLDPAPERRAYDSLRLDLRAELESEIGREIDLVVLNHAPPDLSHRVLRDSVLVIEPDPSARVRFEVRARNEFWDIKPYLDEYRRTPPIPR